MPEVPLVMVNLVIYRFVWVFPRAILKDLTPAAPVGTVTDFVPMAPLIPMFSASSKNAVSASTPSLKRK
jgi:hypothetical protein